MKTSPRRARTVAMSLVALAVAVACEGAPPAGDANPSTADGDVQASTGDDASPGESRGGPTASRSPHAWLQDGFVSPGATVAELTHRFGPPDRRSATPTPNRHIPDQTDSLVTLEYDAGLTLRFYAVTGGDDLLQEAVVSAPGVVSYDEPVDVGAEWETVTSILGPPSGTRDGAPFYACDGCPTAESPVFFDTVEGTVRRIRFSYYVD